MTERINISEQLSAYLDGELDEATAQAVEAALAADAALARELQTLRTTRELVRRLPREKAPDDFATRLLAQAERLALVPQLQVRQATVTIRWLRAAATAAVTLLAFSIALAVCVTIYSSVTTRSTPHRTTAVPTSQPVVQVTYGGEVRSHEDRDNRKYSSKDAPSDEDYAAREPEASSIDKHSKAKSPYQDGYEYNRPYPRPANVNEHMKKSEAGAQDPVLGKASPHDKASAGTTKGEGLGADVLLAELPEDAQAILISTDRLPDVQKEIEAVLAANGAVPLSGNVAQQADVRQQKAQGYLANVYEAKNVDDEVRVIQAVVPADQASAIQKSVEQIRSRQVSRQRSVADARRINSSYIARANVNKELQQKFEQAAEGKVPLTNTTGGQSEPSQPPAKLMDDARPGQAPAAPAGIAKGPGSEPTSPITQPARQPSPPTTQPSMTAIAQTQQPGQHHGQKPDVVQEVQSQRAEPTWQMIKLAATQPEFARVQRLMITLEYRAAPTAALADRQADDQAERSDIDAGQHRNTAATRCAEVAKPGNPDESASEAKQAK